MDEEETVEIVEEKGDDKEYEEEDEEDNEEPEKGGSKGGMIRTHTSKYKKWLRGDSLDAENSAEHVRKVTRMDQFGDGTIAQFLQRQHINEIFAKMPEQRAQQPGTVAAYIVSFLTVAKWLRLEKIIESDTFEEVQNCLAGIKSSVYKKRKMREGRMEAEELLIDSLDIAISNKRGENITCRCLRSHTIECESNLL
ncbi:hypothetical protein BSL78_12303 [Apostichopus japonicus]|uniref:Uncharacterized protein n=1 Tax=Stichopus japonicus TaxID=307972 RepID=A0A2G8KS73_STIJA|nr:hypothetical protein BSL78_12303 [Apostichopus japonicus]